LAENLERENLMNISLTKVRSKMFYRLFKVIILSLFFTFNFVQSVNAKYINFACELFGEEGIASDLWVIDPSKKIAIHQAGSEYGEVKKYGLKYRVDEVRSNGIVFSIRMFDPQVSRTYGFNFPLELLSLVNGDIGIIESDIGRRLNYVEKQATKEISNKLYNARMFVFIDFSSKEIVFYSPAITFDLSKTDKIFDARPYQTPETINNGRCVVI